MPHGIKGIGDYGCAMNDTSAVAQGLLVAFHHVMLERSLAGKMTMDVLIEGIDQAATALNNEVPNFRWRLMKKLKNTQQEGSNGHGGR